MEPLIHFIVPFVALMLAKVEFKRALAISLFALLPDLDALFLVHRSFTHSIVVMLVAAAPILLLTYRFKPEVHSDALLALASGASHLALDIFGGFTPILWPLYGYSVWIKTELGAHIGSSPSFLPGVQLLMKPTSFQLFESLDAPLLTGEGLIVSLVLLLPILLRFSKTGWQRMRELATR